MIENPVKKITTLQLINIRRDVILKIQSGGGASILNSFDDIADRFLKLSEKHTTQTNEIQSLKTEVQSLQVQLKAAKEKLNSKKT